MSTEDAEAYTEHWGPVLRPAVDRLLDELAPVAALSRHSDGRPPRLLDLGTGTGQLAFAALERRPGIEVVGIDRDAAMLEVARRRSAQIAMSASLSLVEGGAQELPFEDAAFDLVASSFVIDLLDRRRAFREVRRVLRQGGAFGAVAWLPAGTDFAPRRIIVDALADVTPPP
jgi:ubiquinone/menaquinone biosynthesis C-methylase UbiE